MSKEMEWLNSAVVWKVTKGYYCTIANPHSAQIGVAYAVDGTYGKRTFWAFHVCQLTD